MDRIAFSIMPFPDVKTLDDVRVEIRKFHFRAIPAALIHCLFVSILAMNEYKSDQQLSIVFGILGVIFLSSAIYSSYLYIILRTTRPHSTAQAWSACLSPYLRR